MTPQIGRANGRLKRKPSYSLKLTSLMGLIRCSIGAPAYLSDALAICSFYLLFIFCHLSLVSLSYTSICSSNSTFSFLTLPLPLLALSYHPRSRTLLPILKIANQEGESKAFSTLLTASNNCGLAVYYSCHLPARTLLLTLTPNHESVGLGCLGC